MVNNNLGRNIKSLRTAYGETQLELALVVGLDSPNAIANYKKKRSQSKDIKEYDEELVRKYIKQIKIYDDKFEMVDCNIKLNN